MKSLLRNIRAVLTFWVWGPDIKFLKSLREHEAFTCLHYFQSKNKILDFGAGSGHQAKYFQSLGFEVRAIDVDTSNYRRQQEFDVINYDGVTIPFPDKYFDVIFSSNVFEHIPDTKLILTELSRVLKPEGTMVLLMPSSSWRIWTIITSLIGLNKIRMHGEHAKNVFHEILIFRSKWWQKQLKHNAWQLKRIDKNRLLYSGNNFFGPRVSFTTRRRLSYFLGSSCNIYLMVRK